MKSVQVSIISHGLLALKMPFSRIANESIKELGGRWAPEVGQGIWTFPADMWAELGEVCKDHGWELPAPSNLADYAYEAPLVVDDRARPYQLVALNAPAIRQARRFVLNFDPGLGKTFTSLLALRSRGAKQILIVCPASVRDTWEEECHMWWPSLQVSVHRKGAEPDASEVVPLRVEGEVVITSYELFQNRPDRQYDAVVWDELHYLVHKTSSRTAAAHEFVKGLSKDVHIIGLTGTLVPNEINNLWGQVEALRPGAWGSSSRFTKRYCTWKESKYGIIKESIQLRPDRVPELQNRIAQLAVQVRKQDLPAEELPSFNVSRHNIDQTFRAIDILTASEEELEAYLAGAGNVKVRHTVARAKELAEGGRRLAIGLYHKEVAREVFTRLQVSLGERVYYVDGDMTHKARQRVITNSLARPDGVLVVTMPSVSVGINTLKAYTRVLVGQLYWQPALVEQFLARFHRLGSKDSVEIELLILRQTIDERLADTLEKRLKSINSVLISGTVSQTLESAMEAKLTLEQFRREMAE